MIWPSQRCLWLSFLRVVESRTPAKAARAGILRDSRATAYNCIASAKPASSKVRLERGRGDCWNWLVSKSRSSESWAKGRSGESSY